MKTFLIDYILSSIAMVLILCLALGLVAFMLHPLSVSFFGIYQPIIDFFVFLLCYGVFSGGVVRLLLRMRPFPIGEFNMESREFTYYKLLSILIDIGVAVLKPFTPVFLRPVVWTLFGAKLGKDVGIGGHFTDPYLISAGDYLLLGNGSQVTGDYMTNGKIAFGRVKIGNNVAIGMNSVILPDVEIGDGAAVLVNSVVMPGTRIPAGETWRGNPARKWTGA